MLRTAGTGASSEEAVVVRGAEVEVELLEYLTESLLLLLYMDQIARMDSKANATFSSTCSGRDDRLMAGVLGAGPRPRKLGFARSVTARGAFLVGGVGERNDAESRLGSRASLTTRMLLRAFERRCD